MREALSHEPLAIARVLYSSPLWAIDRRRLLSLARGVVLVLQAQIISCLGVRDLRLLRQRVP